MTKEEEYVDNEVVSVHSHRSAEAPAVIHPTKHRNNAKKEFLERMARLREQDGDEDREDLEYLTYLEKLKKEK